MKDVFISHAGEDKREYVHPLVDACDSFGITYWLDEAELNWGDKVLQKISEGLTKSRYILVLLTENFIAKYWPMAELESALHQETSSGRNIVLPVFIASEDMIFDRLPLLRNRFYLSWENGPINIAKQLLRLLNREYKTDWVHSHAAKYSGKVWIRISRKPTSKNSDYSYEINWGPWQNKNKLVFGSKNSVTLWQMKGEDELSIPIFFKISPECYVEFGTGEPTDASAIDINHGWNRVR